MRHWNEAGQTTDDARRSWEEKWKAPKQVLKAKQTAINQHVSELQEKVTKMQTMLRAMARERRTAPMQELADLEAEVKQLEEKQAKKWRRFSKLRWIRDGDAPSKFFFAILKARRAQEEITTFVGEDGQRRQKENSTLTRMNFSLNSRKRRK
ncbi:hypothetical protein R1sor_000454 [Riccia sorocarpa]|uniref:Uncharacterized protein n=1 Tax=Riccia sorocarpa TaxID=122646 RepID=A0ABD3GW79_9MARC